MQATGLRISPLTSTLVEVLASLPASCPGRLPGHGGVIMIVVVGGTGRVGRQVVTQLTESGRPVRSVSRGPGGLPPHAEAVQADLADPASLEPHLQDAQSLFLLWPFTSPEVTEGLAPKVAEVAARHAGRIVYL